MLSCTTIRTNSPTNPFTSILNTQQKSGVNSNGAIVHYRAVPSSAKTLGPHDMVLLDSGGQVRPALPMYLNLVAILTTSYHLYHLTSYYIMSSHDMVLLDSGGQVIQHNTRTTYLS